MNYAMVRYLIGWMLGVESLFLLLPMLTAILYREPVVMAYLAAAVICLAFSALFCHKRPENTRFYAREGFVTVALCWIVLALTGALPFLFSGEIPFVVDALFETISGFTTTGATILSDVEALSHASLLWRSLTHWVGGMGVLVFMLIVLPLAGGQTIHLMRAESPGPSVSKLSPHLRDTAMYLYAIYFGMTVLEIVLLMVGGMPLFDAACTSMATAGTGGFGIQFFASGAPETDDPEKTARSMARDLGIELVDGKDACTIVESDGDNVVLELACASGGAGIINCRVEFRFMYGRLYSVSGVRPLDLVTAETETSLIDVPTALMRFLGLTREKGHICSELRGLELCYAFSASASGEGSLTPAWLIVTDTGEFYINAITGKEEVIA